MAANITDIVMSDLFMEYTIWDSKHPIKYVYLKDMSLEHMTEAVMDKLDNTKSPLNMTINIYQYSAGYRSNTALERSTADIMRTVQNNPVNKVAFCSVIFKPDLESEWENIAMFNQHLRLLNSQMKVPPMNLHKAVMRQSPRGNGLVVRGWFWKEYCKGYGNGFNLNYDGKAKVKEFIVKYHNESFNLRDFPESPLYTRQWQPLPLRYTEGFKQYYQGVTKTHDLRDEDLRQVIGEPEGSSRYYQDNSNEHVRDSERYLKERRYDFNYEERYRDQPEEEKEDLKYKRMEESLLQKERELLDRERKLERREKENDEWLEEFQEREGKRRSEEEERYQSLVATVRDCAEKTSRMSDQLMNVEATVFVKEHGYRRALVEKELEVANLKKQKLDDKRDKELEVANRKKQKDDKKDKKKKKK